MQEAERGGQLRLCQLRRKSSSAFGYLESFAEDRDRIGDAGCGWKALFGMRIDFDWTRQFSTETLDES
jgi:hypothetical protein